VITTSAYRAGVGGHRHTHSAASTPRRSVKVTKADNQPY